MRRFFRSTLLVALLLSAFAIAGAQTQSDQYIDFNPKGLANQFYWTIQPPIPYDESQPPGPQGGLPQHITITFNGETSPYASNFSGNVIYIIPAAAYRQAWDSANNTSVTNAMSNLTDSFEAGMAPNRIPILPPQVGAQDVTAQVNLLDNANIKGYRFIGRHAQDANPVTNDSTGYMFSGYSADGAFYISAFLPFVRTDALPDSVADADMNAFNNDPMASIQSSVDELNELGMVNFQPNLETIDRAIESIYVSNGLRVALGVPELYAPDSALGPWRWQSFSEPTGEKSITVEDPANYQITVNEDFTYEIVADCNTGRGTFNISENRVQVNPAAMTRAFCGEAALDTEFMSLLSQVSIWSVQDGKLLLEMPYDSGTMVFGR